MGFELRHPVGLTTHTFVPGKDFEVTSSSQERVVPRIGHVLDVLVYSYMVGSAAVWRYARGFAFLSGVDMTALEAFFDAAGGELFEFKDGTCGPVTDWRKVALDPESYRRRYDYVRGQRQKVQLFMLEVP